MEFKTGMKENSEGKLKKPSVLLVLICLVGKKKKKRLCKATILE